MTASLYGALDPLPFLAHGWFYNDLQLRQLFLSHSIKCVVEVGSWVGLSTIWLALAVGDGGSVYAVDHWNGWIDEESGERAHLDLIPDLYHQFLSNMIHSRVSDRVVPLRMESVEAAAALDVEPDLIYIDASHDFDSVWADLTAWSLHLKAETILCGDDWLQEGVRTAVELFGKERGLTPVGEENFWQLQSTPAGP